jgi:hypothetical protein
MTEKKKSAATQRRERLRQRHWPVESDLWTSKNEKGWFSAPKTLPLILSLLKTLTDKKDPSTVYLELLSRHMDSGVIEMESEADHAYAAGYEGQRAIRTWRERMEILKNLGLIRTESAGNQTYKYVALVHPTDAVHALRDSNRVSDCWWNTYCARKTQVGEPHYEERAR